MWTAFLTSFSLSLSLTNQTENERAVASFNYLQTGASSLAERALSTSTSLCCLFCLVKQPTKKATHPHRCTPRRNQDWTLQVPAQNGCRSVRGKLRRRTAHDNPHYNGRHRCRRLRCYGEQRREISTAVPPALPRATPAQLLDSGADEDPEGDEEAESDEDKEDSGGAFQTMYYSADHIVEASKRLRSAGETKKQQ